MDHHDGDGELPGLERQLVILARRFRANAERFHPELTLVGYSLLTEMAERDGVRAGDLTGLYGLNKSTISRQVADLHRAGLVVRDRDPANSRVQLLRISDRGRELLALAATRLHREVAARTHGWTPEEVATLHRLLGRYNASPAAPDDDA
ncbi:MarR family winged helix-turn-helix transcriptional regulator [Streptomyces sp. BBFR2]|uniref:MarR family winged helix-turn-helix transcriptional regulator n=1 Tax=Streptomyces sp. BBFR2 TaxID=3372854 RepID=UPI0037DA5723